MTGGATAIHILKPCRRYAFPVDSEDDEPQSDLATFFYECTKEKSAKAIAERAGLARSTVARQFAGRSALKIETVVAICRAYDLDFGVVFAGVGFLTPEEVRQMGKHTRLTNAADADLAAEMLTRLRRVKERGSFAEEAPGKPATLPRA